MMRAVGLDEPVAADEALLVVVRLEVVEIAVEDGELALLADLPLDLLLDPDVAGQPGEGREIRASPWRGAACPSRAPAARSDRTA